MSRKTLLLIRLIVLILLLLVMSFVAVAIFSFNIFENNISLLDNFRFTGENTQQVQTFEGVEEIELDLASIDVKIVETSSDIVTLYDNTSISGFRLGIGGNDENKVNFTNGTLTFTQAKSWGIGINMLNVVGEVVIEVPKGSLIEYEINSASSDVYFDAKAKDKLDINIVSGEIEIEQGGDELDIETVSGDIYVYDVFKNVDVNCVSSDLNMVADETTNRIGYNGVSGDVEIEIENDAEYNVEISSVSGDINDDYNNASNDSGAIDISVDNVSGDIYLQDWR